MQFVFCAIGSLKWRSARVFWKGAKGPALPRNFGDCYWECLSHSVLIAQLKNLEQNSYEHLKMYFTDFHQLIGQLVRSQGVWRRICERVQVTTGQASHTSDVLAPACAGAHMLALTCWRSRAHIHVLWDSERVWFPALHVWVRWPGSPWVDSSVPERWLTGNSPAREGVLLRQNSLLINSVPFLTSSLVEC